jgi:hypothetical protein
MPEFKPWYFSRYTQTAVNRRCRRAVYTGRLACYYWLYRESWRRFRASFPNWEAELFGVLVLRDEDVNCQIGSG